MGQVERYGVFALCVVIFLILGIAIWGGGGPTVPVVAGDKVVATKPAADPGAPFQSQTEQREPKAPVKEPVATFPDGPSGSEHKVAATPPAPAAAAQTYRIKKDDTLARIAARELGDKRKVDAILAANPGLDALKLRVNQEIRLPAAAPARDSVVKSSEKPQDPKVERKDAKPPEPDKKADKTHDKTAGWPKQYKVASGDKLATIARRFYGDGKKSALLAKANGLKDQDNLRAGMLLTIPAAN
jgi:nucleoid-associated protein YgaU